MTASDPGLIFRKDENDLQRFLKKNSGKTADALQKRGIDPQALLQTEIGFICAIGRFKGTEISLDSFQARFLACRSDYRSLLKSRQVGYSWIMAVEMIARSHLRDRHNAVCVSYNLDDAKEKIALIKELHDELPLAYQKKMVIDSKTEVAFQSRMSNRRISKIQSFPSKAPRGKSGDVYIDEFAFCLNDKHIYGGATAVISRAEGGQLTIGSTPFGQRGMFYRIHVGGMSAESQDREEFGIFYRMDVPWWLCRHFCRDVSTAAKEAPLLSTPERVKRFGTNKLLNQFGANLLDDFRQEYELEFQDERVAFFPHDLILSCCHKSAGEKDAKDTIQVFETPEELALEADSMGPLFAGFDVGRTKHPSELIILEEKGDSFVLRYQESFSDVQFQTQFQRLSRIISILGPKLRAFRIDRTGLGMNLSEDLRRKHGRVVEEWTFTNQVKVDLANNLKILFENRALDLPKSRNLVSQLGSIRQKISESGNAIFDVVATQGDRHHGDLVWSLALAAWRKRKKQWAPAEVGIRILGEKNEDPDISDPPEAEDDLAKIFEVPDTFVPRRPEFAPDVVQAVINDGVDSETVKLVPLPALEQRKRMLELSISTWKTKQGVRSLTRLEPCEETDRAIESARAEIDQISQEIQARS